MATRERQRTGGEWRLRVGTEETSAVYEPSAAGGEVVFVFAHGAGGNMHDRAVVSTSRALQERGIGTVRFNFLYKEKKSGRPDPMPKLKDTFSAVVEKVRGEVAPDTLIIGGRSMGGRAASMLAADDFDCAGLLLLAYPLHPPGKPDQLRDAHLPAIKVPVICFNGTRDPFCTPTLMEEVLKRVKTKWEMHWVDGADHSFHVPKSSGKTDGQVLNEMADQISDWTRSLKVSGEQAMSKLEIKRTYDAPLDVVWTAWADSDQAKQWWGPRGFTAPVVELDERPGGKWRALMVGPDGTELWQHGVYRGLVPKKRIVYTFIWDKEPDHEMLVSVDFAAKGKKTEIAFRQTGFKSDGEREGHKGGWTESFDRLAEYLKQIGASKKSKARKDAHAGR